jgi:hypothetical protein
MGVAESREAGAFGVLVHVDLQRNGAQFVGRAA